MKKIAFQLCGVISVLTLSVPVLASAQTATSTSDIQTQIQSLLTQIQALQQQLHSLMVEVASSSRPVPAPPPPNNKGSSMMPPCGIFARDLRIGSSGDDVMQLQQTLASAGFLNASSTGYFGSLTAHALVEFQNHFGISSSSAGYFGPLTRQFFEHRCEMGGSANPMPIPPWNGQGSTTSYMPCVRADASSEDYPKMYIPCGGVGSSTPFFPPCGAMNGGASTTLDNQSGAVPMDAGSDFIISGRPCQGVAMPPPNSAEPMMQENDDQNSDQ